MDSENTKKQSTQTQDTSQHSETSQDSHRSHSSTPTPSSQEESATKPDTPEQTKPEITKKDEEHIDSETQEDTTEDDDLSLDLTRMKKSLGSFFGKKKTTSKDDASHHPPEKKEERHAEDTENHTTHASPRERSKKDKDENLSLDGINIFIRKNKHFLIPLLLVLLVMGVSVYLRAMPASLPITDNWAEDAVLGSIQNQVSQDVVTNFPNLPTDQRNQLIAEQTQQYVAQNRDTYDQQVKATSQHFKEQLKDEDGHTYLLAIDPYFWWGHARNVLEYGKLSNGVNAEGKDVYLQRNGRFGKNPERNIPLNAYAGVLLYKIMSPFSKDTTLRSAMFLLPLLTITLACIPAFFIGRKFGGNVGGFFAGLIVAMNVALLGRTPAGFADTDAYNVFFPLLIAWLYLELHERKNLKMKALLAFLTGGAILLYSFAWLGSWFVIDILIGVSIANILYLTYIAYIKQRKQHPTHHSGEKQAGITKRILTTLKPELQSFALFIIFSFGLLFLRGSRFVSMPFRGPASVVTLKDVAVTSVWPNVFTTVAEFRDVAVKDIIGQMGGNLFFGIAILGLIALVWVGFRKLDTDLKVPLLIVIWFFATLYGFTKGVRFSILMVPAFAIAFGAALGLFYKKVSTWAYAELSVTEWLAKGVLIIFFLVLFIQPFNASLTTAKNEVPSMNDAWWNTLIGIKEDSTDAIITSWWDFGHWFYSISERRVTFDGADQGRRIHWVGKTLLTRNETIAVGTLRMLNCGQERAPDTLQQYITPNRTLDAVNLINEIIVVDKEEADAILESHGLDAAARADVLQYTHCDDIIPQYYITSQDMIGKAGVWGHFGSWDFRRATIWNQINKVKTEQEGVRIMTEEFNISEEQARTFYREIKTTDADQWVSPWPGYVYGPMRCTLDGSIIVCPNLAIGVGKNVGITEIDIDLENKTTVIGLNTGQTLTPYSLSYATSTDVLTERYEDSSINMGVVTWPDSQGQPVVLLTDPLQATSMFTRLFFMEGHGLKHFKKFEDVNAFTGERIITWKVDFEGGEINKLPYFDKNITDEMLNEITRQVQAQLQEKLNNGSTSGVNGSINGTTDQFTNTSFTSSPSQGSGTTPDTENTSNTSAS